MSYEDDAHRRAQQRVGRVLRGKWTLDRLLGIGGMAAVYAGTHRNGTRGAIKILRHELATQAEMRSRFLREGYAANSIGHPGVVRAIDDDEEDATVFLVMELLDGESVDSRAVRHGKVLPPSEVLSLADQVLDILAAAHAAGVIHRDIKPENLSLTSSGEVKLLDFGIARIPEAPKGPTGTQPGATMGTPVFMAPEQARGRWSDVDGRTDLWAVGAMMFTLISGEFVHVADTENEQLLGAMSHRARSLATVAPNTPASVVEVIDRALQYEREGRWPDAQSMQNAVRLAYHGLFGKPITTAPKLQVPVGVEIPDGVARGTTTGGRAPAAFARTTLGKYLGGRGKGLAVSLGAAGTLLVGGAILIAHGHTVQSDVPAASSPSVEAPTRHATAAPAFSVEPPRDVVPVLSPSELPPAEPDGPEMNPKKIPSTAQRPRPTTSAPSSSARTPLKLTESEASPATAKPPSAEKKRPAASDVLDQQW